MGKLDLFAKDMFAEETPAASHGAAIWLPPTELSLCEVRLDGLLKILDPARLARLPAPWRLADGLDEIVLENKMQGDHLDLPAECRAVLRRQARQVQRVEDPAAPWKGEEPLWVSAPNVSAILRERRTVTEVARGCYRVGPYPFQFLWIAANELPLEDELIPFLVARSGRALDEFCLWAKTRLAPPWLERMVSILPMLTSTAEELVRYTRQFADDPEIRARQRWVTKLELDLDPELREQVVDEGRDEGRLLEVRKVLRGVLGARALPLGAEETTRIDACTDLAALERWVVQAVVAASTAEALR